MRILLRLAVLLSVMLLPFGMAPAGATTMHHQMSSMPMQHCPEQRSDHQKRGFVECTMACSAALPALDRPQPRARLIVSQRERPSLARRLSDLHPDTATPPPRDS
jgi:hypothetical protein